VLGTLRELKAASREAPVSGSERGYRVAGPTGALRSVLDAAPGEALMFGSERG
jgi:hypothetical protein